MAPFARQRHSRHEENQRGFQLRPLPYEYSALEPAIDRETVHWQHDVIQRGYVERLDRIVRGTRAEGLTLEDILANGAAVSQEVLAYAGAQWNMDFYWQVMTDQKEDQEITPDVLSAIERSFATYEDFRTKFVRVGQEFIGSGWLWVVKHGTDRLELLTTPNHENPLMENGKGTPILACSLWEHSYYLKYKARKEDYLKKFFTVINWNRVHTLFVGAYH